MLKLSHGGNATDGGREKYPLNTSQKKRLIFKTHQIKVLQHSMKNTPLQSAGRRLPLRTVTLPPPCCPCRRKSRRLYFCIFSATIRSRRSGKCTEAAGVWHGITYIAPCRCCGKKWRCFQMTDRSLVPYETIVRVTKGEPEAVDTVLRHYSRRIQ